ncbi:C4b-binding protein alpha chain [Coregonus clupeaformis]|uniref:C4b-binding protein alpha chain n=1 Tax=Coregonus clupeaformis TaxID=59861 RepID=UPI001BE0A1BE|nr:C4b-binding protein alpha chain [Coregonus clupeaformis]
MQICRDACCCFLTVWLVCLTFEVETIQAQCSKPIGGSHMRISADYITQETFLEGSKVVFECDVGYVGRAMTVTCNGETWKNVKSTCQRTSCGSPGEVMNGWYDLTEGVEFGARATAQCNKGHYIVGSKVRNCMAAGWSARVAICEVVKCGGPPVVANGSLLYQAEEWYAYGEVVEYQCDRQLTLVGPRSLHCSETGQFEPDPPKCIDVICPTPKIDNAVRVEGHQPLYRYKSFVRYECKKGYEMEGESSLTCEIDSTWSATLPTCKEKKTPEAEQGFFSKMKEKAKAIINTFLISISELELYIPG